MAKNQTYIGKVYRKEPGRPQEAVWIEGDYKSSSAARAAARDTINHLVSVGVGPRSQYKIKVIKEPTYAVPSWFNPSSNPAKFDRCVKAVKKRGGAANAYAVCTAAGTRKNRKSAVRVGAKRKKNPAGAAVEAYKDFHGQDPKEMVSITQTVHYHKHLAGAGDLRFLVIENLDRKHVTIVKFTKGVLLAFNEKRNQLFVEGGDQSVNLKDFGIAPADAHELETLGKAKQIGYFTEKVHLRPEDGGKAVYDHKFRMTNQNGQHVTVKVAKYPDVIYRVIDQHLEFSGGSYKILSEGIDK